MKPVILDITKLKKFSTEKRNQETVWSDEDSKINLICMLPGQEIVTHTHHGSHIWMVVEGSGEFLSGGKTEAIGPGKIIVVPTLVEHGIRCGTQGELVLASITAIGD